MDMIRVKAKRRTGIAFTRVMVDQAANINQVSHIGGWLVHEKLLWILQYDNLNSENGVVLSLLVLWNTF